MKDTLFLWKTILSKPEDGYRQISAATRIVWPLILIVAVALLAGLLLVPVVASDAYQGASVRANLDFMDRARAFPDAPAREQAAAQLASPLNRGFTVVSAVIGPALNFLAILLAASLVIWLLGLVLRQAVPFGIVLRIFAFTWAVFAWQSVLQSVILLMSDHQAVFAKVNTLIAFRYALAVPFSLSLVFPPGSLPPLAFLAVDFVTNIFNIIFYVLLAIGLRAQRANPATWKTGLTVGLVAILHFGIIAAPAFVMR
jgi:hypothetical protein